MASREKRLTYLVAESLTFTYLALFPLGQLIRLSYNFFGLNIPVHPLDVVVLSSVPVYLSGALKKPRVFNSILGFYAVAAFSLILSLPVFPIKSIFIATLYLLRLFAYGTFFVLVWNLARKKLVFRKTLFGSLILVSVFTAIFGWIQYFWLPDLTSLKYIGWDDHLFRLVGTFLDPAFTGIILVLGFFASLIKYLDKKTNLPLALVVFLLVSTAFTYSRASYLAVLGGIFWLAVKRRKFKVLFWVVSLLVVIVLALPRPGGEGVRLERLQSVYARAQNYSQTLKIIASRPLFGVGFDNICQARTETFGGESYESHACSGADSSLLFVAATTGTCGLLAFLYMFFRILRGVARDIFGQTFIASSLALLIHSLFSNSLFYAWVMGWMGILLAISVKDASKS